MGKKGGKTTTRVSNGVKLSAKAAATPVSNGATTLKSALKKKPSPKTQVKEPTEADLSAEIDAFINDQVVETAALRPMSKAEKKQQSLKMGGKGKKMKRPSKADADDEDGDADDDHTLVVAASTGEDEAGDEADLEEELEMKAYLEIKKEERKRKREAKKQEGATKKKKVSGEDVGEGKRQMETTDEEAEETDDDSAGSDDDEDNDDDKKPEKIFINDKAGLLSSYNSISLDEPGNPLPWIEFQAVTSPLDLADADVENDLKRELAIYKQALHSVTEAHSKLKKLGVPIERPADYYAEMIKSDDHMMKIRQKLIDESNQIQAAEKAKKLREAKKFGKKVQQEKLAQREKAKRDEIEKTKLLRKKSASKANNVDEDDEFGISVDNDDDSGKGGKAGAQKGSKANGPRAKRRAKDAKFGFGGAKRHAKSNTRESTNDFDGFNPKKMKTDAMKSRRGGKGGPLKKVKQGKVAKRPGKAMRQKGK